MADIELVIKIPEEDFERCKKKFQRRIDIMGNAIANGTPLPKGHGDLIDVNRKITVPIYDEQYEEWMEETLTVLEALNGWSNEGVTAKDIIIPADAESEREE